ncbi:MAG: maltotransferase domain-containing protein, partial [Stellaceae bacterium]
MAEGLRIYNLFPTLAGNVHGWAAHLPRIAAMRFNAVYLNPFHYPGFSGSLYAVKDYYRLNPRFRDGERDADDALLRGFTAAAHGLGLKVIMDLVVNHTARDSELVKSRPHWFARDRSGALLSPYATDPADPSRRTVWGDLAELDYRPPQRSQILGYFQDLVRHYLALGFDGFRCDAAYKVPAEVWQSLIEAAKREVPDTVFLAETLGAPQEAVLALGQAGFDYLFNSGKWWDFESPWLLDQYETFRPIAPSIGFPESHDTGRLVSDLLAAGFPEAEIEPRYRQSYAFAAAFSTGVMMPIGFEFGWSQRFDVVAPPPQQPEPRRFDLSAFIADVNAMKARVPALNEEGPQRRLSAPDDPLVVLMRQTARGGERAFVLVNTHERTPRAIALGTLFAAAGSDARLVFADPLSQGEVCPVPRHGVGAQIEVAPLGLRVLRAAPRRQEAISHHPRWRPQARIRIEEVRPELDCGRHPVKRILGETFEVWADLFRDGHDLLRAVVRYAPESQPWREAPLAFFDNDRWVGRFPLDAIGRWRYTIEAWTDRFESWRAEVAIKREAGQDIALELVEGRDLVAAVLPHANGEDAALISDILRQCDEADPARRGELMLAQGLREAMARADPRADAQRFPHELEIIVDRARARFAAWYEMFPRSQGTVPGRGATFDDGIARLPAIADLGFDVVYLVPIHPIGRVNRKGRDNAVAAKSDDPGSPYAIGSVEGGHRAVDPALGTLADFRRFVRAADRLGMEVALDFAIQCAPDHPWVKEHPAWFRFRPDGTIKFAENPPKKYQDIVNLDLYNPDRDGLWAELRDTVLFWIGEGVHIFRVDNPHTKPLPFWEWLIREVTARHPETIFLSEAFTRPKMMRALSKTGFTQSYTYFIWRNTKAELTEYLTELTQGSTKDYFRPNFFTNTPDILSFFLQEGGRPAFRIRLALAATLSPAYGIYNGFELCENTPIPGREEYLHSEKYEYKVWDWDRPGHIKDDIRALNRFRRENPALQEFLNLRFLESSDPAVLAYVKATADRSNIVAAAVNLDPHAIHESDIALPLDDLGLPSETG